MLSALIFAGVLGLQVPDYICRPAGRAVREMGERFGENWEVAEDVGRNVVVVRPGDDDAGEVRAGLAEVLNAEWLEFDDRWVLRRSDEQRAALVAAERAVIRRAVEKERVKWKVETTKGSDVESWLRRTETLLTRVARNDSSASSDVAELAAYGGCLQSHFPNALLSLPLDALEKVDLDHPLTFSTRPKPGQLLLPKTLVDEVVKYQREYLSLLPESLERVPSQSLDPRTRFNSHFGEIDRIIVNVEMGTTGTLILRGFYVDREGWVVSYANRIILPSMPESELTCVKGIKLDVPEKAELFRSKFWDRILGKIVAPVDNSFLDVNVTDPADWVQGSILSSLAQVVDRSLYAVLCDSKLWSSSFMAAGEIHDANLIFSKTFDATDYLINESHGDIRIRPGLPLRNESAFLDRTAFSTLVEEFRREGYLRPHAIGRYAVAQDSAVAIDSWDIWTMVMSLPDNVQVFTKFYRFAYLMLGTAVPQPGKYEPGRFAIAGSHMTESVWKRVKRELQSPFRLSEAYPESKSETGELNISGLIVTESYPDGLPRNLKMWVSVQNEQILVTQNTEDSYLSTLYWAKRGSALFPFMSEGIRFATATSEIMTYGVGNSRGDQTEVVFPPHGQSLQFGSASDMPFAWRDWLIQQDALYREQYPDPQPVKPPPP